MMRDMPGLDQQRSAIADVPQPGVYQHFKGGRYQLLSVALHSETEERLAVYRSLEEPDALWVRPLGMFTEEVSIAGRSVPRFRRTADAPSTRWDLRSTARRLRSPFRRAADR